VREPPQRAQFSAARPLRVGVFGWIERHKRVDIVLEALAELRRHGVSVELDVCGQIGGSVTDLDERIAKLGVGSVVHLRGRLEHDAFLEAIRDVDVCVNLRDPTMGETSAVVTHALQMGTPVIASDIGWYAELPECVLKVPVGERATAALVGHILRLANDRGRLAELGDASRRRTSISKRWWRAMRTSWRSSPQSARDAAWSTARSTKTPLGHWQI
jgi:glycosyltransferase involved in cell wall biosynthesis